MNTTMLVAVHRAVMDELVPTIIRGTTHQAVYAYLIRFGRAHRMFQRGAERPFLDFCVQCHARSRDPGLMESAGLSTEARNYLAALRALPKGVRAEDAFHAIKAGVARLTPPKPSGTLESILLERAAPLAVASAESISKYLVSARPDTAASEAEEPPAGVDWGEVFDSDLGGLIAGGFGAAAATWWTGGAMPAGTAIGAAAGAVAGSGIAYLEQDAKSDGVNEASKQSSTEGGSVWESGESGSEFDSRWHDGDGYGLG